MHHATFSTALLHSCKTTRQTIAAEQAQSRQVCALMHARVNKRSKVCLHLLGGLAWGCAGEGANRHNVLRLGVQPLLGAQVQTAQQSLHWTLGHRGDPCHPLAHLLGGSCMQGMTHQCYATTALLEQGAACADATESCCRTCIQAA